MEKLNLNTPFKGMAALKKCVLFIGLAALCSCSRYQYVFVDSHLNRNDKKEFITENDTVQIKYSFAGENFPIIINIFNKLQEPIYIDWSRSVIVMNHNQITGSFDHEGQISFIAPNSTVKIYSNRLKDTFFNLNINDPAAKISITSGSISGTRYQFDEKSTPLSFRSILALTTHEDYSFPTFFDNSFWISDIIESGSESTTNSMNQFFIRKNYN
jgi:hypothetical protein